MIAKRIVFFCTFAVVTLASPLPSSEASTNTSANYLQNITTGLHVLNNVTDLYYAVCNVAMETDSIIQAYQGDSSPTTAATVEIAEQNLYDVCNYLTSLIPSHQYNCSTVETSSETTKSICREVMAIKSTTSLMIEAVLSIIKKYTQTINNEIEISNDLKREYAFDIASSVVENITQLILVPLHI